jgi:hypothetical protein
MSLKVAPDFSLPLKFLSFRKGTQYLRSRSRHVPAAAACPPASHHGRSRRRPRRRYALRGSGLRWRRRHKP